MAADRSGSESSQGSNSEEYRLAVFAFGDVGLTDTEGAEVPADGAYPAAVELKSLQHYAGSITKIASGTAHTAVLLSHGDVLVWGDHRNGRLGLGPRESPVGEPVPLTLPGTVVDIACGGAHTVALLSSGKALSWGCNKYAQLGNGSLVESWTPTPVVLGATSPRMVAVACGDSHSVLLSERWHVFVFGRGMEGQAGSGKTVAVQTTPHIIKCMVDFAVKDIAAAGNSTALVTENGQVWMCGDGTLGALGQSSCKSVYTPQQVHLNGEPSDTRARDEPRDIPRYGTAESYRFSRKLHRSLKKLDPTSVCTSIAIGWGHTLFLDAEGRVHSCGLNSKGQLGIGLRDEIKFCTPVLVDFPLDAGDTEEGQNPGAPRPAHATPSPPPNPSTDSFSRSQAERSTAPPSPDKPEGTRGSHLFVDSIVCGSTFSAALSGSVLLLWGSLPHVGYQHAVLQDNTRLDGKVGVPTPARRHRLDLGGPQPVKVPASAFGSDEACVRAIFAKGSALLAVVEVPQTVEESVVVHSPSDDNPADACDQAPSSHPVDVS